MAAPPSLDNVYSGAPPRLATAAAESKARLISHRTLPDSTARKNGTRLPPGLTAEAFAAAMADIERVLGKENVAINDGPLKDGWYLEHPNTHDAMHLVDPEELVCSAVVYPATVEDVQAVVHWANKHLVPIYPISLGRNLGYGGAAPRLSGSVVVDLGRRMNRILNVDAENASCLVEPGVTYFALYEEIQRRGLPLWIDTPDVGGGSVLGNAIDRGVGYTPYGDHFANHCGMEVVLPTGHLVRTGMGAMPGPGGKDNPTWQSFQHAYGPSIDGIFSQSNFGIVTKMGFHLMPATEHQSYCITFPEDEDFELIVDTIRPLAQQRTLGNIPQLRHIIQELAITGRPQTDFRHPAAGAEEAARHRPLTRAEIRRAAASQPLGECAWVFYGTQYGPSAAIQVETIHETFRKRIPGAKLFLPKDVPQSHNLHNRVLICSGVPVLRDLDWLNWVPNGSHLGFSPIAPTRGKDARVLHEMIVEAHQRYGFDLIPTLCVAGREMHYITEIVFDRSPESDMKSRAVRMMREMITKCAEKGFGEYRTHLLFADQVAQTYSWGGRAFGRLNETIKDALDPNGIMSPGRNGIWPKRFRGKGWELGESDAEASAIGPGAP